MNIEQLNSYVTLLVAVSLAAERLVDIVKGIFPKLALEIPGDAGQERRRILRLQVISLLAGLITAWLLPQQLFADVQNKEAARVALGILASSGSAFWNSILGYLKQIKEVKKAQAVELKDSLRARGSAV